jgi:hypothetical protein
LTTIAKAVEVNSPYLFESVLVSFLPQRNQKQYDADRRQNNSDSKARGRDLAPVMIIFFEMPSEAYQERKNANAEQNQPDRSLVIVGDFHWQRQSNIAGSPKFKCAL